MSDISIAAADFSNQYALMPIGEAIERFLADLAGEGKATSTLNVYRRHLEFLADTSGAATVGELNADSFSGAAAIMRRSRSSNGRPYAARTVNQCIGALKRFGRWATARWVFPSSPCGDLRPERVCSAYDRDVFEELEIDQLVYGGGTAQEMDIVTLRDRVAIGLISEVGLRPSEIRNLERRDFYARGPGGFLLEVRDSKSGSRRVPLSQRFMKERFVPYFKRIDELLERPDGSFVNSHALLPSLISRQGLDRMSVMRGFRALCDWHAIEIGQRTLYDLRHTFATRCIWSGWGIQNIMMALGHRSIQTTLTYVHMTWDMPALEMIARPPESGGGAYANMTRLARIIHSCASGAFDQFMAFNQARLGPLLEQSKSGWS